MRSLLLLALLGPVAALAGDPAPAVPAPTSTPVRRAAREDFGTPIRATAPNGSTVSMVLRDEYLAGQPILVEITVANEGAAPVTTPDLSARPHLVHFKLVDPKGRTSERFTTPPQFDTGGDWTLAPKSRKSVLLEIPSSPGFDQGSWKLNVLVGDGSQAVVFPEHTLRVAAPRPTGGDIAWEPVVDKNSGALVPWVHAAKGGHDVYLNHYAAGDGTRLLAHHWLFRSSVALQPLLSRTLPTTARSRWLYWTGDPGEVRVARLEGTRVAGDVRSLGIPWSSAVPLARAVSDAKGGFALPLWVPNPKGTAGAVRVLTMAERGEVTVRDVAVFDARPPVAETGVDAGGNAVLVLAHPKGLDVFRLDPTRDARLPAQGVRAWKAADGWTTAAVAFDVLPDKDGRAGGLSIQAVQLLAAAGETPAQMRSLRVDLGGKLFDTTPAAPWAGPSLLTHLLPDGYGAFHYVGKDAGGQTIFGTSTAAPVALGKLPDAHPWQDKRGAWSLRWLAGETIVSQKSVPTPAP